MGTLSQTTLSQLMDRLGYVFARPELLVDALTHPSLSGSKAQKKKGFSPYERLEFLGDRVLGLVIAQWLYQLYPKAKEGELAKRHAALVNRDVCRDVAAVLSLDEALLLAGDDMVGEGRKNLAAMSDAMEAVIGAMYLDGGIEATQRLIRRYWEPFIHQDATPADPKTALQEWAQGKGLPLPVYKVISRTGPAHAPMFEIEVLVKGVDPVLAKGPSKRDAEKAAAILLLKDIEKK